MLAVTGWQEGLHELFSVMAPIVWGDFIWAEVQDTKGEDILACSQPEMDTGPDNLVLRAAALFRQAFPLPRALHFSLKKNIPIGAGLGGGSSDGAGVLRLLNALTGNPLNRATLCALAFQLGSDCPFFIDPRPALVSGRGERVRPLARELTEAIGKQEILLFKPHFAISTAWTYSHLDAKDWQGWDAAENRLSAWRDQPNCLEPLLCNDLQKPVFVKYLALPLLLETLREHFGLACQMTGSGSACFALIDKETPIKAVCSAIRDAWGQDTWIVQTPFSNFYTQSSSVDSSRTPPKLTRFSS